MEAVSILAWLGLAGVLATLGAPLAAAIFAHLPCRGGAFAAHLGLAVVGLASFWIGHVRYGWIAAVGAIAVLVGLSVGARRAGHAPNWSAVIEGYFALALGSLVALAFRMRANTITPQGGEQFLHFGLLNAVERADRLPPMDMWFAGEPVRYYYGGHVLVDQVARLTLTEPRVAYNLGLALVFGLAVAGAYGLVAALAAERGHNRRVGGAFGVFFLVLAGPVVTAVRLVIGHLGPALDLERWAFAFRAIRTDAPLEEVVADQGSVGGWFWWHDRYVIDATLTEVPMYSLVKADLHGHVTTIPFMVLIAAVGYAYVRTPAIDRRRRRLLMVGVMPALAGLVGWMNLWSLPGAVGIAWLAMALGPAPPADLLPRRLDRWTPRSPDIGAAGAETWRVASATAIACLIGLLAVGWIAPFAVGGVPTNDGIGVFPDRSHFGQHLLVWGGFLAVFAGYLGARLVALADRAGSRRTLVPIAGGLGLAGALALAGMAPLALATPVLLCAWWLARRDAAVGYVGVLTVGGLGLVLSMELLHAEIWPPDRARLNTTYKVSMQAWILCALGAGGAATDLLAGIRGRIRGVPSSRAIATVALVGLVVVVMALFPAMVMTDVLVAPLADGHEPSGSIDALESHETVRGEEVEAVEWLDDRAGTPIVLEAPGRPAYSWVSPASSLGGAASVAGWEHQRGYRGIEPYEERVGDVDAIYTGDEAETVALIVAYEVDYIWVGEVERERYGVVLNAFDDLDGISVAFENEAVRIYEVDGGSIGDG